MKIPHFYEMMNPVLKALHELGGSGSISEINGRAIELMKLPEKTQNVPHDLEKSSESEVEYRLAWTRTYLKKYGLLENSSRGIWSVISKNNELLEVDANEVVKKIREDRRAKKKPQRTQAEADDTENDDEVPDWKIQLAAILKNISSKAFERLIKRLLREAGFEQVEVTGGSGDGGIDGKGIAKINSIMSFHVYFQCKRYKGSVSSSYIRDFRGAMTGRADKGIFITTGSFTRDAIKESTRDGAPPIDLIDGDQLAEMLKSLSIGIAVEKREIEDVTVSGDFFRQI